MEDPRILAGLEMLFKKGKEVFSLSKIEEVMWL